MNRCTIPAIVLLVFLSVKTHGLEVMTWVPAYSIAESYENFTVDFGGTRPVDVVNYLGLQFWSPTYEGGVAYHPMFFNLNDDKVAMFRKMCDEYDIKLLLTIFNFTNIWDWDWAMAAYKDNRSAFVNALYDECVRLGLDGVDLDMEGLSSLVGALELEAEREPFGEFVRELATKLHENGMILTVCTFHTPCWNAPNMGWWPDWLGYADFIHIMGYMDDYESREESLSGECYGAPQLAGNTDFFRYSWKVSWGVDSCGYDTNAISMGIPAWLGEWGDKSVRGHLEDLLGMDMTPGVCFWNMELPHSAWREPETWALLKQVREKKYATTGVKPEALPVSEKGSRFSVEKDAVTIYTAKAGSFSVELFDASGRLIKTLNRKNLEPGSHRVVLESESLASSIRFVRVTGPDIKMVRKTAF